MTMSKLAKMQDASLEKLKLLSAAGRNQLQDALEQQKPQTESAPTGETATVIPPAEPQTTRSERTTVKRVVHGKRIGRPPLGPDMRASTVYLPEAAYAELETLAGKSGKKGFKRPGLSETVRAVIRLAASREWSSEEIRQAFVDDAMGGE
jgi:hypothetical protein